MKSVFADFHCIDTGIKHGTVTVVIDGEPLEITTSASTANMRTTGTRKA